MKNKITGKRPIRLSKKKAIDISFALELILKTWDEGGHMSSSTAGVCCKASDYIDEAILNAK